MKNEKKEVTVHIIVIERGYMKMEIKIMFQTFFI